MLEVLICGAGPTGLLVALLLQRLGVRFRIIDQNSGPAKESRALGIQARTMELFHQLGLVEKFLERGMPARGAILVLSGKEELQINVEDMARPDTLYPYIFLLSQAETEKILLEELVKRGVHVERETSLISFTDNKHHIDAVIRSPDGVMKHIPFHYLCGCDGSHSRVRKVLGQEFKGDSYPTEFVMADAKVDWKRPHDKVQVFLESGKVAVFFPVMQSDMSRVLCITPIQKELEPKTEETTAFNATLDEIEKGLKDASHVDLRLSRAAWVTRYHIHHRSVDRMRVGNAFLLGDAAHIHSPLGAQGMNTGLQDANNLAWKIYYALKHPELSDGLLETYQLERLPIAKKLIAFTDRIFAGVVVQNKILLSIRDMVLPVVAKSLMSFPQGKRFLFKFISQLNIHYHPNFVMKNIGVRAPNSWINNDISMHDLLKDYDFKILAFKRDGFTAEETASIHARGYGKVFLFRLVQEDDGHSIFVQKEIFDYYGVTKEGIFLVRPDGYIAFYAPDISSEIDFPKLEHPESNYNFLDDQFSAVL